MGERREMEGRGQKGSMKRGEKARREEREERGGKWRGLC